MINFNRFFNLLDSPIIMDFIIPFLLIFSILWASLQKIKIFGERKVNMMLSVIISLLVVIPHVTNRYPGGKDPVEIIMNAIPQIAVVIIAIIMLFILLGLFFGEKKFKGATVGGWISVMCMLTVLWIFGASAGWWSGWSSIESYIGTDSLSLVIIILVFGMIIRYITKEEDKSKEDKMVDKMGRFFGGD